MGKVCSDNYMDAMLQLIDNATNLAVLSAEPANQAAISGLTLANATLTAGDGGGDYTIANGDTSGRKLTVAQQDDLNISSSGTATHVSLDDGTNFYVTTCTSQALTSGGTVTTPAWDIEVADPS